MARARSPGPLGTNDRTRAAPQIRTGAAREAVRPAPRAPVVGQTTSEVTRRAASGPGAAGGPGRPAPRPAVVGWTPSEVPRGQACGPEAAANNATETDPPRDR